jgi:hypothetical protein
MKIHYLALALLFVFSGCYHAKDFKGESVEHKTEDYYSAIEPVRIGVEESVADKIGYDNQNLNATGMKLTFFSKNKESEVEFSDLEAYYSLNGSEEKEMETPYFMPYGPSPGRAFQAYLVPSGDIGPPQKEYDFASIETRAIPKGRYEITVLFKEDGQKREVKFDFSYASRTHYQAPNLNVSGK